MRKNHFDAAELAYFSSQGAQWNAMDDTVSFRVTLNGGDVRKAQQAGVMDTFTAAMQDRIQEKVDALTRKPNPCRLGAGTHGYRGRRR
jgi:hypothetical protein